MDTTNLEPTPYIIKISNPGAEAANVDIGDSVTNRTTGRFKNGSLVINEIIISSEVSGASYLEFLSHTETKPPTICKTILVCINTNQLDLPVQITHRNTDGNRIDHIISSTLDPYQKLTDRLVDEYEYVFDGFTRLRFEKISASTDILVYLYEKSKEKEEEPTAEQKKKKIIKTPKDLTPPTEVIKKQIETKYGCWLAWILLAVSTICIMYELNKK